MHPKVYKRHRPDCDQDISSQTAAPLPVLPRSSD
jgi:hypothetical protein